MIWRQQNSPMESLRYIIHCEYLLFLIDNNLSSILERMEAMLNINNKTVVILMSFI